jgi:hypothetical protein
VEGLREGREGRSNGEHTIIQITRSNPTSYSSAPSNNIPLLLLDLESIRLITSTMVLLTDKKYTNLLHSLDSRRRKIRKLPPGRD